MANRGTEKGVAGAPPPAAVVYWRPGCPYCARLCWSLRRAGVASKWIDIWSDPSAAAFVRSVNGGNETVPTVVIGDVTLVNPGPRQVTGELARQASEVDRR